MKKTALSLTLSIAILGFIYRISCGEFKDKNNFNRIEEFICLLRDLNIPDDPPSPNYSLGYNWYYGFNSSSTISTAGTVTPSPSIDIPEV